jgi:hypothetical protein
MYLSFVLGVIYAMNMTSFFPFVLHRLADKVHIPSGHYSVWAMWLVVPALLAAVAEKIYMLLTIREHEKVLGQGPFTTISDTLALAVPAGMKGLLWGGAIALVNALADGFLNIDVLRDWCNAAGLP